jgi:hypothetical protein
LMVWNGLGCRRKRNEGREIPGPRYTVLVADAIR